ncbi:hypothetical protein LT330_001891 [Penicillium expansum]|nr:hypothetical protein LT330_001891 [Penicillium expansum]
MTIPQMIPVLHQAILDNPGIATKAMREQFEKLVLQPLQKLERSDVPTQTMILVIDALDECEGDSDIRLILGLLPQLQRLATIRLRILLTSRPDLPIRLGFTKIASNDFRGFVLHDIPMEVIEHDISLFIDHRLAEIRTERFLHTEWPDKRDLRRLVALSVPLFIFAATICRIFEDPDWDPTDSLAEILTHQNNQSKLERTYLPILDRLLGRQQERQKGKLVSEFQQVIGAIVTLETPLTVNSLSKLLDLPEKLIQVDRLTVDAYLPPELHALLFLQRHFLRKHFLHWVEAMSLLGLTSEILGIIDRLQTVISGNNSSSTSDFLHDAKRFILKNVHIVDQAPLQVYCAALIFAPETAIIRRQFQEELPTWICQLPRVEDRWGSELRSFEGHSSRVQSVTFSPDSRLLASGSHDNTVRLWDPATGALTKTLEGHLSSVMSVAFSSDGRLLASGSDDKTVRLWDPLTGALIQTLEGHLKSVASVAFSSDGRLLASGSGDKIVRLWNPAIGALTQILEGHLGWVVSVAFSSDGRLLASGSDDKTVRLWDTLTGALIQKLEGHPMWVWTVAFSPDDRLLASGAGDEIVRIWDPATGALTQKLEGHSNDVLSVTFSPNGQLLASGSGDNTVRLWDPATGALIQTLESHSFSVQSVAFSPDGRLLASASSDKTVRLWDPLTGALNLPHEGHSKLVDWVAFSPKGRLLASSSGDNIVRLWNPVTGALTQTLKGYSSWASSGAFSPDERLLASGMSDGTVQLWDLETGGLIQKLEGYSSWVSLVAFSPDGRLLTFSSGVQLWDMATDVLTQADNTVWLWDVATGTLTQTLEGHLKSVASVAFSPDSRQIVSSSEDKTMRLWDVATGALSRTWNVEEVVTTLEFSYDGSHLRTNFGILDIQSRCEIPTFHPPYTNLAIVIEHDHWIKLNGEKALWLPVESRPNCFKVNGNTLALGHASGRISFIGFCL